MYFMKKIECPKAKIGFDVLRFVFSLKINTETESSTAVSE